MTTPTNQLKPFKVWATYSEDQGDIAYYRFKADAKVAARKYGELIRPVQIIVYPRKEQA